MKKITFPIWASERPLSSTANYVNPTHGACLAAIDFRVFIGLAVSSSGGYGFSGSDTGNDG
jgi:hypothetical protein